MEVSDKDILSRKGKIQIRTPEEAWEFAKLQMRIEDPSLPEDYFDEPETVSEEFIEKQLLLRKNKVVEITSAAPVDPETVEMIEGSLDNLKLGKTGGVFDPSLFKDLWNESVLLVPADEFDVLVDEAGRPLTPEEKKKLREIWKNVEELF